MAISKPRGITPGSDEGARASRLGFSFMASLRAKAEPATVDTIAEGVKGPVVTFSDGRTVSVDRTKLATMTTDAEVSAYAGALLAKE